MKKALALWFATMALAAAALVGLSGQANAVTYMHKSNCTGNGFVCMHVWYWKDTATSGIGIQQVIGDCVASGPGSPVFGWDSPAVDGHNLDVFNNTGGNSIWNLGETSNVYVVNGSCENSWQVNVDRPGSHSVTVTWDFTEQLNALPDEDHTITVNIANN